MSPFIIFLIVYTARCFIKRDIAMKLLSFFLMTLFTFFFSTAFADTQLSHFISSRDLLNIQNKEYGSNIFLQNNSLAAATVYGLYVRQYAYVLPGQSCDSATIIYSAINNTTAGAFLSPTLINKGKSALIGGNYLYNMIYEAIYYEYMIIPSSPPGCALPGCTWGSDTTQYNWCIYIGALAPVSNSSDYTSNVPPSADLASSTGFYNYNLISNYSYIGPIACNDKTLTCAVSKQQVQTFF